MTMQEKINFSAQPKKVYLFKEGLFYKLYNQNAMWFTNHIKAYNVNSKFVKTVKQNVYSIGFPQTVLAKHTALSNLKQMQDKGGYLCYQIDTVVNEQAYANWCYTVTTTQAKVQTNTTSQSIVQQLKAFDVANSTPMQALEFVANLKTLL